MKKNILIVFPIHLFTKEYLQKIDSFDEIYILEEPIYFGDHKIKMKFNKKKLLFHRASMKYYEDYLKKLKYKVKYIEYSKLKQKKYPKGKEIYMFDVVDFYLEKKLKKEYGDKLKVFETPLFMINNEELEKYENDERFKKKYFHKNFYEWIREEKDILIKEKSYDSENRKPIPKNLKIPEINTKVESDYVDEAKKYVEKNWGKNYGDVENLMFPITHKDSVKWYKEFLKERFSNFGTYQDAIVQGEDIMFHSGISPMQNVGLLLPDDIVDEALKYGKKNKIKMNHIEGFVRQIIGWREYSRYLYRYAYDDMKSNYFGHKRKLSKHWYDGTLGVLPIDDTIKTAFRTGYLHHILRLMMMSNFMNLSQLHPDEVYKWFMEFSCDSYDWVMINNVYSMGTYADGGLTMRKPYLSSSNYILKMSNYKKDGQWELIWNNLYYYFLYKEYEKLRKTALVRNLGIWDRKSAKDQDNIISESTKFLREVTK